MLGAAAVVSGPPVGGRGEEPGEPGAGTIPALQVTYESSGLLPGDQEATGQKRHRQIVTVDDTGLRLRLRLYEPVSDPGAATGQAPDADVEKFRLRQTLLLRMDRDPPVIWEILPGDKKEYFEHSGDLNSLQADRRIAEMNELKLLESYPAKDRAAYFREHPCLRADGSRTVTAELVPGETVLGYECRRLVVKENGCEILDIQLAQDEVGARSYFQVYRRLGAFSEEVLDKLKGIKGLPLRGRLTIVTALPTRQLEVEAKSIHEVRVPADAFDLPQDAVKIDREPEKLVCAQCKKEIPGTVDDVPAKWFDAATQRWLYFCSEECAEDYAVEQVDE